MLKRNYSWIFIALLAIYLILAFTLPVDPQTLEKYNLSKPGLFFLNLTLLLPLAVIYMLALYGSVHIKNYADSIRETKEGPHFNQLANGLTVLAFSLPVTAILGSLSTFIKFRQPHLYSDIIIFRNYVALAFILVAIVLIARGVEGLYGTLRKKTFKGFDSLFGILGPIALACIYAWLVTNQADTGIEGNVEFLPNWIIIFTLAIPYVYTWCTGIRAALQLHHYKNNVKGVIYQRALNYISIGVGSIIGISILMRFITTISGQINRLNLTPLLFIVYVLVGLYAFGFVMVTKGAKKLKQIEEA